MAIDKNISKLKDSPTLGKPRPPTNPLMLTVSGSQTWRKIQELLQNQTIERQNREELQSALETELREIRVKLNEIIDKVNTLL